MLQSIRSATKGLLVKTLVILLVASFAVWGIGDIFRDRPSNSVATIGDFEVPYSSYYKIFQNQLLRYQSAIGRALSEEEIEALGLKDAAINYLVEKNLLKLIADEYGVAVSDDAVASSITQDSSFFDDNGKFDKKSFVSILAANNMNERQYFDLVKENSNSEIILAALSIASFSLPQQVDTLLKYRNEKRIADLVIAKIDDVKFDREPSETDLIQFYQENQEQFHVKETRSATYLVVSFDDFKENFTIDESALREHYEVNKENYNTAEVRQAQQYLFSSEKEALDAYNDIIVGNLDKYSDSLVDMGKVEKGLLPASIDKALFSLLKGQYSQPVKSAVGWHIFKVNEITPAGVAEFLAVKDQIKRDFAQNQLTKDFYSMLNNIEDDLAAELTIEELADKYSLKLNKASSIYSNGMSTASDQPEQLEQLASGVAALIFSLDKSQNSSLTEINSGQGYAIARVDEVFPARVKALDEAKGIATDMWKQHMKLETLKEKSLAIAEDLKNSNSLKLIASKYKVEVKYASEFARPGYDNNKAFPTPMVQELFSLKKGAVTASYKNHDDNYVIAVLQDIEPYEPQQADRDKMSDQVKSLFVNETASQYFTYLRKKYGVHVNPHRVR